MASGWYLEQTLIFQNKMILVLDVQLLIELETKETKLWQKIKSYITYFKSFFFFIDHKEQYMEYMMRLFRKTDAHLKYNGKNYKDFSLGRQVVHIDKKRYLKMKIDLTTFY